MSTEIRKLNADGLERFEEYLAGLRNHQYSAPPHEILEDPAFSDPISPTARIESRNFGSRYELGAYLTDMLSGHNQPEISHDAGLWSWLALFYFDQLCPPKEDGSRKTRENYTYILSGDYNHHPRHAIRTTYVFVRDYGGTVRFMFSKKLHERGEIVEQLAARQYLFSCRGVIEAAQALYDDPARQTFKRGAAGKGGGSVRRLADWLDQLTLTYDLFLLGREDILGMLPREFRKFIPS